MKTTTLKQLKQILDNNKDKRISVLGTTCVGKTTLLKDIPEGIEISQLAPPLSEEDRNFYYKAPITRKNEEKRFDLRARRVLVKSGQPVFGIGIASGTELIIHLNISDDLLKERTNLRNVNFTEAKMIQKFMEESIKKSGLPVINIQMQ